MFANYIRRRESGLMLIERLFKLAFWRLYSVCWVVGRCKRRFMVQWSPRVSQMTSAQVFDIISTERAYQDQDLLDKKWDHQGQLSVEAEIIWASEYLLKARAAWQSALRSGSCLDTLRKVAAGVLVCCFSKPWLPTKRDERKHCEHKRTSNPSKQE